MEAYSMDLRRRVLAACDAGHKTKEVAELFGVSRSWVRLLKQRRREWGRIEPLPCKSGRKPKLSESDRQQLATLVAEQPDATLKELRERLGAEVGQATIWRALQQLGLTFKKSPCTPASRTGRTSRRRGPCGTSSSPA